MKHKGKHIISFILLLGALGVFSFFLFPSLFAKTYESGADLVLSESLNKEEEVETPPTPPALHEATPLTVKGLYVTACAAGTPSFRARIENLLDTTTLNSVVIDVKDFSGTISFPSDNPLLQDGESGKGCKVKDMRDFVAQLHEKGIYVIGRITVFQDPHLATLHPEYAIKNISDGALWSDKKGLHYLYPGNKDVWEYVIALAEESYALGFDEINFDYIRFPSDGNIKDMAVPDTGKTKADVVESFFSYLHDALEGTGIVTSADLFGMTTTNTDDLGIGQVLERALPYFDYICPMVYPSHYPPQFNGWSNPNGVPYDLIHFVMTSAVRRANTLAEDPLQSEEVRAHVNPLQLRPWLQNFSLGKPSYGAGEVWDQIRATYDSGLTSWLLWDAANTYSVTTEALKNDN